MRDPLLALGLVVGTFFLFVLQEFFAPMAMFSGARVNLVPVLFCYGALLLPFPYMLALAVIIGLMSDLATLQVLGSSVEMRLGWSILFFLLVGLICQGLRPLVLRGHWELYTLMSALTASLYIAVQFGMITLRRMEEGGFYFSDVVTWRILGPGIILLVVAPMFWFAVGWATGWMRAARRSRDI